MVWSGDADNDWSHSKNYLISIDHRYVVFLVIFFLLEYRFLVLHSSLSFYNIWKVKFLNYVPVSKNDIKTFCKSLINYRVT